MQIHDIIVLLGGLALFLYGMNMMSAGLEAVAGNRMKQILEKLTSNRLLGVLVGAGITAVIQSSSATTVMVVGFVNSSLMTLKQAVGVIMGANIGTTITGQLIALDIGAIAPIIAFAGVVMAVFLKSEKLRHIGRILAGLGVLFMGMGIMSDAMMPLRESETFIQLMTQFSNPLLGILAGALFTAIIQSSSASVGILQALAVSGIIGLPNAVYVLFGQNIGTCITAVLASIGTSRNAKRTTLIHLMFNIIGTCVFVIVCLCTPFTAFMESLTPGNPAAQIANVHTVFNIVTTVLLFPFGNLLARIAVRILPDRSGDQEEEGMHLLYLPSGTARATSHIGTVATSIEQLQKELTRMQQYALDNIRMSFEDIESRTCNNRRKILYNEEYVDYLNAEISRFISALITLEMSEEDSRIINGFFKISGNIERISDHATNLSDYAALLVEKNLVFSGNALAEVSSLKKLCLQTMEYLQMIPNADQDALLNTISKQEQKIDDMTDQFRENQIRRMKDSSCNVESGIYYSEMLTDFERIGDHALNIAQAYYMQKAQG
ncbi:Na/Pi cotransporter family protein [Anaerolentibacter hominis]|uniref:Na/Pi cotransporter family protein n=1 Tax=Anaerolentibacter hominis TaxID=3079009 RepID=UPI0031B7FB64